MHARQNPSRLAVFARTKALLCSALMLTMLLCLAAPGQANKRSMVNVPERSQPTQSGSGVSKGTAPSASASSSGAAKSAVAKDPAPPAPKAPKPAPKPAPKAAEAPAPKPAKPAPKPAPEVRQAAVTTPPAAPVDIRAANRLLYSGNYIGSGGALEAYASLLGDADPEVREQARRGIGRILRLAAHRVAKGEESDGWKLANPVLKLGDKGDADLQSTLRPEADELGRSLLEQAVKADAKGSCDSALRAAGRALKAAPDLAEAKQLRDKIRANPGRLTVLTLHGGWLVVDGRKTGETVPTRKFSIPCGSHVVEVVNPDNPSQPKQRTRVSIRAGRETKIQFSGGNARVLD